MIAFITDSFCICRLTPVTEEFSNKKFRRAILSFSNNTYKQELLPMPIIWELPHIVEEAL